MHASNRALSPRLAGSGGGRRAIVLVHNPVAPYSRALRVAPAGSLARFVAAPGGSRARLVTALDRAVGCMDRALARAPGLGLLRVARTPTPRLILGVLRWPLPARAWTAGLVGVLPPADLYHACEVAALVAATDLAASARRHRLAAVPEATVLRNSPALGSAAREPTPAS